jgi:hypothetical protein
MSFMKNFSLQEQVTEGRALYSLRRFPRSLKQIYGRLLMAGSAETGVSCLHPRWPDFISRTSFKRNRMITRRALVLGGLTGALAVTSAGHTHAAQTAKSSQPAITSQAGKASQPAKSSQGTSEDPVAILNAIYARAAKGKGNGGAAFVIENEAAKAKYLSKSLIELWARADANTPKDDVPPIDFDPVTNSQEPDVKSFTVATEKLEADTAVMAVTISGRMPRAKPSDNTIRYNYVRENGKWKIDDISGTIDGEVWSLREILKDSLKAIT